MATTRVQVSTLPTGATASTFLRGDGTWAEVASGPTDDLFTEYAQTVSSDYTITASKNALTLGNTVIGSGITVTVPSGARWYVL
tara:strand:- start:1056 stop:1307 length:252 start_codon:yes stop_codon:yes gene_type:complete